ncbi:MAG: transcription termination/antitermination protein NusG [Planctomycetia bacterium]|nr:transcription termination/antitermination protein NusG [Planctomycetia bacterium]
MSKQAEQQQVEEESLMPEKKKDWYILKVQVNREDTIRNNLLRRVQLAGLEKYFDEVLVPTEKVSVVKNGQKKVTKRKLYPGYLMVYMEINDDTWYLVRETPGIGDFTGAGGKPVPMSPIEVQKILQADKKDTDEAPKLKIPYSKGDRVKITDGAFRDVEGEVTAVDDMTGRVTVSITIFARSTPVDLEYWQAEKVEV